MLARVMSAWDSQPVPELPGLDGCLLWESLRRGGKPVGSVIPNEPMKKPENPRRGNWFAEEGEQMIAALAVTVREHGIEAKISEATIPAQPSSKVGSWIGGAAVVSVDV